MGLLVISGLWGCLNVETTLRVKTDGSGILESTVLMNSQVSEMMNQSGLGAGDKGRSLDLLDKEKLKRDAGENGTRRTPCFRGADKLERRQRLSRSVCL